MARVWKILYVFFLLYRKLLGYARATKVFFKRMLSARIACEALAFLLPVIIFCSCNQVEKANLLTSFSANFTAEYNSMNISGNVTTNNEAVTNISITSPETISGLNINYKGSEMQISRETLICSADEAYLPQESFPSILKSILKAVSEGRTSLISQEDNSSTYSVNTNLGNCEIKADKGGNIKQASIREYKFRIMFTENKSVDSK